MQRIIKFRGKRIDTGEWAYGDFYFFEGANIRHYHQTCHHDEGPQNVFTDYEVITETVGQYTGLKDKNGKDVYNDDVIKFLHYGEVRIEPVVSFCSAITYIGRQCNFYAHYIFSATEPFHAEIIGNIHDNPELLNPSEGGRINMTDPNVKTEEAAPTETEQEQVPVQDSEATEG